jgi:hypothetical protein
MRLCEIKMQWVINRVHNVFLSQVYKKTLCFRGLWLVAEPPSHRTRSQRRGGAHLGGEDDAPLARVLRLGLGLGLRRRRRRGRVQAALLAVAAQVEFDKANFDETGFSRDRRKGCETTWVPGAFQLWVRGSQRAPPHLSPGLFQHAHGGAGALHRRRGVGTCGG